MDERLLKIHIHTLHRELHGLFATIMFCHIVEEFREGMRHAIDSQHINLIRSETLEQCIPAPSRKLHFLIGVLFYHAAVIFTLVRYLHKPRYMCSICKFEQTL